MASTRFLMIGVVLFVVALSALEAYQWDGGPEDKAKITACPGGSVSIPWSIVKGLGETVLDRNWWFQESFKEKTEIATYEGNHFYAMDYTRVAFLPNAGLSLRDARPQDSGNYYVQVNLEQANSSLASVWRTVTLSVTGRPPATQDGAFHVTLSDAVRDDVTEDWTLQLHCGQFVDLGHPPVDVVWKTPSGEVKNSSYQDNGTFVLSVSSPAQGGNYSCQLPPPAVRCLTATSPLNAAAQLYVDDKDVRLSFCEASQRELRQVNKDQAMQISQQNKTIEQLTTSDTVFLRRLSTNCVDWLKLDPRSGIRTAYVDAVPITVYCDQSTDYGGWIVFQRRQDASVDFYRNWTEYRNGFGDLKGNFWLGLDALHILTTSQRYQLRVDLTKWDGTRGYATYSGFYVKDNDKNFRLDFDKFTGGNAGDSLSHHRGMQFSTKDRDNDVDLSVNSAKQNHGAWWYMACLDSNLNADNKISSRGSMDDSDRQGMVTFRGNQYHSMKDKACHHSNLNGDYKPSSSAPDLDGLSWRTFGGSDSYSMKFTEMKIRPM